MTKLRNLGLLLCLSASLAACDDDDLELVDAGGDAGRDGGSDAAVISLDAGLDASIDGAVPSDGSVADASTGAKTWNLTLTKAAEVPACELAGANATGSATVTLNAAGDTITVSVSYSGLSSTASNAHIHYGAAGATGPFVLPFGAPVDVSPIVRTLTEADYEALGAAPKTFPEFVNELRAGKAYVNVHTNDCPPGEIRAQIQ